MKNSYMFLVSTGIVLCLLSAFVPDAWPQTKPDTPAVTINVKDLEDTIKILENPDESKKLATHLRNIIETQKKVKPTKQPFKLRLDKNFLVSLIRLLAIIVFAFIFMKVCYFLVKKMEQRAVKSMLKSQHVPKSEVEKRVSTLGSVLRKLILISISIIAIMMIFSQVGIDIKPILAGAGVVGLAIGFGAQSLVRDIISGLFLIVENRIRVGDVAIINGQGGVVQSLNLRTVILRSVDGVVHVFRNGDINTLSNMTQEFSYYVFDVGVAYKENVDRVIDALKQVGDDIMQDSNYNTFILEPLEIMGLDKFADSAVMIRARIKTIPMKQWFVGREMNKRIKKLFDDMGIEIPFPHQTFYFSEASPPLQIKLDNSPDQKQHLKQLIREVLDEDKI